MADHSDADDWKTAATQFVDAAGTQFAYRRLGPKTGVPLVLLNHWGANLDNFDPRIVEGFALDRPVYAFDYRGIGASGGKAPLTIGEMSTDMIAAIRALGLTQIDLIGFSLGGFVSQQIMFDSSRLVRRAILAGTGPAGGKGIAKVGPVSWPLIFKGLLTFRDPKIFLFFTSTSNGRRAANAFIDRLKERKLDRDISVGFGQLLRQLKAIEAWGLQRPQPLEEIDMPVLIANGENDIMVPTDNSAEMARRIPGARIVLYPDAGHGGIFQYHDAFLKEAKAFFAE